MLLVAIRIGRLEDYLWPNDFTVVVTACSDVKKAIKAVTPGQCSGMSVDAVVFLAAHRRRRDEKQWWTGHMEQTGRRYVGCTRAREHLYLLNEQPPT